MSENNNNNRSNNVEWLASDDDKALWATACKSARMASTYGVKASTTLARLAASLVLAGSDLKELRTAVAEDESMTAIGVKAASIAAYYAPLKRLAACLPAEIYHELLISDKSAAPGVVDRWARDASMVSAKVNRAMEGLAIPNRASLAAAMLAAGAPALANKGDANKGDANKGDANKGASKDDNKGASKDDNKGASKDDNKGARVSYGDTLELFVDSAQALLNMVTRGELSDGERRMLMRNVSTVSAAFDAACAIAVGK